MSGMSQHQALEREMADWLRHYFPGITPAGGWGGDPCWLAFTMTREAEHNPPFYWLGKALDVAEAQGVSELFGERLRAAHGAASCEGTGDRDDRVQDVLTEVCGYAWTSEHLGVPEIEPASEAASNEVGPIRLHVASANTYVAPRRLRGEPTMERLVYQVAGHADESDHALPGEEGGAEVGRILFADIWHERMYAQNVGYRLELTEPVQAALRHFAGEHHLGYVLTRPFEWGRPIEASY
jgi:hypothetical protein